MFVYRYTAHACSGVLRVCDDINVCTGTHHPSCVRQAGGGWAGILCYSLFSTYSALHRDYRLQNFIFNTRGVLEYIGNIGHVETDLNGKTRVFCEANGDVQLNSFCHKIGRASCRERV